ncbi:hypothetical protein I2I05_14045 [Hymenobacter sp. BT683]|uniref:Glycoside hydrolase family 2 catalytic domain-containing protein n=1 Tax=Hymenobacter jeongseonensis TaxID=2791027 RepID=A0ABS0IKX9_9BACT|nr:glycoside hydrolase family 2 TIM barrel-domain containing protein [Hymenobacter jeongseonensis]MBF9238523.1 hypothetical protein [Hymenobacter jeongseonensis]
MLLFSSCNEAKPPIAERYSAGPNAKPESVIEVKVDTTAHGFRLLRGGQPYFLRGGGGLQQYSQLRAAGGNTVRLWSADYAGPLLDEAHRHGLTVMLGLWVDGENQHFSYYDPAMVQDQLARIREQVLRYRHHPALLMWNIGNEVELKAKGPRLFEALKDIAHLVHELDPYHPVTISMTANLAPYTDYLKVLAPEIDILSLNVYGQLGKLPALVRASGWRGPYIVTEYGGRGHWESDSTAWKVALEQTSSAKAEFMSTRYRQTIAVDTARCLGSYVFFWGTKFEYTPTWFSLFEPTGEKTEMVDELHLLWRKQYPANRAPHLTELRLAGYPPGDDVQLQAGQEYPAVVTVTDPEGDSLTTRWEVLPEMRLGATGKEKESPLEPVIGCVLRAEGRQATIRTPTKPGTYRLYVRVFDGHGSVGTANIPMLVRRGATPVSAVSGSK